MPHWPQGTVTPSSDIELLARAIEATGLSSRQWAERIAWRDERTIRRWRTGESPIGDAPRARMQWLLALDPRQRAQYVALVRRGG